MTEPPRSERSRLQEFLDAERQRTSYRELEDVTGVSRGSLENIIRGRATELPQLETLLKIANAYRRPLYEIVEMAGVDLGLPRSADERAKRLGALVQRMPELETVVGQLGKLYDTQPDVVNGMLIAMEAMVARAGGGGAGGNSTGSGQSPGQSG